MNSSNNEDNGVIDVYVGRSKDCALYTIVLTFSTFVFVASMILTVYLTHISSMDKAVVVLIVGCCFLYLLGFTGNMYSIYHIRPNIRSQENGDNINRLNRITSTSPQNTSMNVRAPDIVSFSRARELFRTTPPPPYEVQMSEMSRMLMPGTSRTTESSEREAEISEEARKLIHRMYEEIQRTYDELTPQSSVGERSVQHIVQTPPKPPARHQEAVSPKISHQNLGVQKQQAVEESSSSHRIPPVGFPANQNIQQKGTTSSLPTQLDLGRFVIGSEGFGAVSPQPSPRISGRPPVDFCTNQFIPQIATPSLPPTQPDLRKFAISTEDCTTVSPRLTPRSEEYLKVARKRKLTCPSQELQAMPKTEGKSNLAAVDKDSKSNEYEEIEVVGNIPSKIFSQPARVSVESEFEDISEQASSVTSAIYTQGLAERKKFGTSSVKARPQLSVLSTRKFCKLGQSPETVLDAIATCFDLTPDEWMFAWKLSRQNVSPEERARILGVRLQADP